MAEASTSGPKQQASASSAKKPKQSRANNSSPRNKHSKRDQRPSPSRNPLQEVVASGEKRKVAAYESLQQAGFMKSALEFLEGSTIP